MARSHRKIGKGSLQLERNGTWTVRLMVDGRSISRNTRSRNRNEALYMLGELVREQKEIRERDVASMLFLGLWKTIAKALSSAGMGEDGVGRRFTVWRLFSEWMHDRHPEVGTPEAVGAEIADEYMRDLEERCGATSCNSHMYALRAMFSLLVRYDAERANPWAHIRRRKVRSHSRRSLTKDEIERLIAAAAEEGLEWKTFILLGAGTGQGIAKCCAMRWSDVNLDERFIRIAGGDGIEHRVAMNDNLHAALMQMRAESGHGLVLPNIAGILRRSYRPVQVVLARIFAGAGIETAVQIDGRTRHAPDATFLSLRNSFIEFAARNGVPLDTVKAIVGSKHKTIGRLYRLASGEVPNGEERPELEADVYSSLAARLAELGELRRLGLISEREYKKTCRRICFEARRR